MKKWTILLLTLALLLGGCAADPVPTTVPVQLTEPQPTQSTVTEDPGKFDVTLDLWVTEDSIWADEAAVAKLLEDFRVYYPNITVNVQHVSAAELGNDLPDLLLSDTDTLSSLAGKGELADLTELWQGIGDAYGNAETACGLGGIYFALPLCQVVECMAINLEQFEDAGCMDLISSASHTWSSGAFLRAAENLSLAGVANPVSIYCKDTAGDAHTRLLVEMVSGGRFIRAQDGACLVDSQTMRQGLTSLSQAPGVVFRRDLDAAGALEEFLAGKSAMVLNWNSALQLEHHDDGNFFYMLCPGSQPRTYAKVYGLAVCATEDVRHYNASMTLAAFLRDNADAVRAAKQLPARKSGFDAYKETELESRMEDLSKLLSAVEKGELPGNERENVRTEWVKLLQKIAAGEDLTLAIEACRDALAG